MQGSKQFFNSRALTVPHVESAMGRGSRADAMQEETGTHAACRGHARGRNGALGPKGQGREPQQGTRSARRGLDHAKPPGPRR